MPRVFISIGAIQVLIMLVGLARMKSLSLLLGPGGVGVVGTLDQAIVMLGQASAFGLGFTSLKFMARSHSDGHAAYRRSYAGFLRLLLLTSVTVTLLIGIAVRMFPVLVPAGLEEYRAATLLAMAGAPVFVLNIFFINTVSSSGRGADAARLNLVLALALALPAVAGAWFRGVTWLYGASLISGLTSTLAVIVYLARSRDLSPSLPAGDTLDQLRKSPEIVSVALMAYVTLVAFTAMMFATRYFALAELGAAEAGRLQAQLSIALSVGAVLTSLNNLHLMPLLNRQDPSEAKLLAAERFARMVVLLFTIGAVPVVLFPSLALRVLYSREFVSGAAPLVGFVLWQLLYLVVVVYQQLLLGLDDVGVSTIGAVFGSLLTIALTAVLTPRYGAAGVALALSIGVLASGAIFHVRLVMRHHGAIPMSVARRVLAATAMLVAGSAATRYTTEFSMTGLAARGGVAALIGLGTWLLLHADERASVVALIPTSLRRRSP